MKSISISHLKARLSEYLRLVHGGSTLVVTDRGTPVAMVSPLPADEHEGVIVSLIERGLVAPPKKSLPQDFWERSRPSDTSCLSLKAVLKERDSDW